MYTNKSSRNNLLYDRLLIVLFYTIVIVLSLILMIVLPIPNFFIRLLVVDIISTLFIYTLSVVYKNTSVYDPYWSVYPLFIAFFWYFHLNSTISLKQIIILVLVVTWSTRLTSNWIQNWGGMNHEDWRYKMYRKYKRTLFELINLFGLQVLPTFWVYLGCLSLYPALIPNKPIGLLDIIGILVIIIGILFETVADIQLHRFKNNHKLREYIKTGLWKYSRHPNYFGEIIFWWGLFFLGFSSDITYWWTIIGPVFITILFIFISVPLMEKHCLERRDNYKEYQESVSTLVPWFPKRRVDEQASNLSQKEERTH